MGLINSILGKYAEVSAQRDVACVEAASFVSKTEEYILSHSSQFIDMEWVEEQKEQSRLLLERLSKLTLLAIKSRTQLVEAATKLREVNFGIESRIYQHNERVAYSMLAESRKLIGDVEGRQLDNQQITCIVKQAHNHLVIAGAGTGKTTTIVGKIKYLLLSEKCKPEDILVLSFTNASATEMSERIRKETNCNIKASTFHKLGLDIITKVEGKVPKISKINLAEFCRKTLMEQMKDSKYVELLCYYFLNNYKYDKTEQDFKTKEEYQEYLHLNPPTTLKGEKVKSYGEMDIANFLFRNGIAYEYEREYEVDTRTEEHAQYYPDFYLPEYQIYLEYFGIDRDGKVPAYFSASGDAEAASKEYQEGMEWKRQVHQENETVLLESYAYEKADGTLLSNLEEKLKKKGVSFSPVNAEELWQLIVENNSKDALASIAEMFSTIITLIKSNNYTFEEFKDRCAESGNSLKSRIVVPLIEPIFQIYKEALSKNDEIDFNDMINKASDLVRNGSFQNPFKYVIVDEYQDISKARFQLLKALRDSSDYDLFCVGDDWQSIYRFAGSDMGYILNFQDFWGPTIISKIETTYRFTKSLIEISGQFVMQNPAQFKKMIKGNSDDVGFALGEIKGYNEQLAVQFMVKKLEELPKNSTVYFVGRYAFDAKMLDECQELQCHYDNEHGVIRVLHSRRQDLKMSFITAHRSKGLQADYVFIINNKGKGLGFPSTIQDDPIIDMLLEGKEYFPYAEERRLFYVALTRARKKTFILTIEGQESIFAKELEKQYENELKHERFSCPLCGGRLEKKTGQYGDFFGCSNYKTKGCKYIRKINGKPNVTGKQNVTEQSKESTPAKAQNGQEACPKCGGKLVLRTAKTGPNAGKQFYGCSKYPACTYTRKK